MCWPVRPSASVAFEVLQYAHYSSYVQQPVRADLLLQAPSMWPTRSSSQSQLSSLRFVPRTSFPACTWLFPLFPVLFSSVVSSPALDATSLFSSVAGTLRLPPFCVYFHRVACFPEFLHAAKVWTASCYRRLCMAWVTHPFRPKLITSGEFVDLADLLSTNIRAVDLER